MAIMQEKQQKTLFEIECQFTPVQLQMVTLILYGLYSFTAKGFLEWGFERDNLIGWVDGNPYFVLFFMDEKFFSEIPIVNSLLLEKLSN